MSVRKSIMSREDWIKAAFRALTTEGLKGVRVEALARALKISKGSFYWHFKDQKDLRAKMLDHWMQVATLSPRDTALASHATPRESLRQLVTFAAKGGGEEYGGQFAEIAVREWARVDELAQDAVQKVDVLRLKVVQDCFEAHGQNADQAAQNARLLYATLIGMDHLQASHVTDVEAELQQLLEMLLLA